jgi:dTDP-glucose pyrophosphorylase
MTEPQKTIGIILAAGDATRIGLLGNEITKTIMPILNMPLMEYHIRYMKQAGINEIIIVIGAQGPKIIETIGNGESFGVKINYIEQKVRLGIAHALGALAPYITCPFVLILGDIYFITKDLKEMINKFYEENLHGLLATKIDTPDNIKRNFTVLEDERGFVKTLVEKPYYVETNLKGCGLYMFSPHIFDAIRKTPRTALRDEYELTNAIQIFIDSGHKVKQINNIHEDLNLTYPHDLLEINLKELKRLNSGKTILGKNVSIKNPNNIYSSILGDNVIISNDIVIKNSLIFPGTIVNDDKEINCKIITPFNRIDCESQLKNKFE